MADIYVSILWYLVFIVSVSFHEAAHAWVANRGGDSTAYHAGQVSFDPLPHILREPFGMVILPLISLYLYGWPIGFAHVPFNIEWARKFPRRAALMSLAGPGMNLALALVAAIFIRIGFSLDLFSTDGVRPGMMINGVGDYASGTCAMILSVFFTLNLVLAFFNLMPFPPLDGSGVVSLFLTEKMSRRYQDFIHQPFAGMIGLLLAWNVFPKVFSGVYVACLNLLSL